MDYQAKMPKVDMLYNNEYLINEKMNCLRNRNFISN